MTRLVDAWRLAVGTLTALPTPPPQTVDRHVGGIAMLLAPVAAVPLGLAAWLIAWGGLALDLAPFAVAVAVVGALALGTRAFHLDGLADTADGLTASYDRERSLAVMKTGDVGPAGAAALVLVLLAHVGSIAWLLSGSASHFGAAVGVGVVVVASRCSLGAMCARGIPSARPGGLGDTVIGAVPVGGAALSIIVGAALVIAATGPLELEWWRGLLAAAVAGLLVAALARRAVHRLGGLTGDLLGASVEVTLAVTLIALT